LPQATAPSLAAAAGDGRAPDFEDTSDFRRLAFTARIYFLQ
jgi:hypothetical protein